uniref:Uncharacterized protein n=1 Tax=Magallana gigas TaxID=29159 RepID=A0A8W8IWD1_MAGGI
MLSSTKSTQSGTLEPFSIMLEGSKLVSESRPELESLELFDSDDDKLSELSSLDSLYLRLRLVLKRSRSGLSDELLTPMSIRKHQLVIGSEESAFPRRMATIAVIEPSNAHEKHIDFTPRELKLKAIDLVTQVCYLRVEILTTKRKRLSSSLNPPETTTCTPLDPVLDHSYCDTSADCQAHSKDQSKEGSQHKCLSCDIVYIICYQLKLFYNIMAQCLWISFNYKYLP